MTDYEATATRLLPCVDFCGGDAYDSEHAYGCAANYRPAVAAALAEAEEIGLISTQSVMRENHYAINVLPEKDRQYDELKAELESCRLVIKEMQEMNLSKDDYVKGLEFARELIHEYLQRPRISGWWNAIQAEIDKAAK